MTTSVRIIHADCRDAMREMAENSVDAVVTDAPYGLSREPDMAEVLRHWLAGDDYVHKARGFMQAEWDSFVPGPSVWREAIRILKPGGFCLSFFGDRTYGPGEIAMRLAGFEIKNMHVWLHGSGMPKVGYLRDEDGTHLRDGWGGSVRPMLEPLVMARKPLSERTLALNVRRWGTGALNVDGCRVETVTPRPDRARRKDAEVDAARACYGSGLGGSVAVEDTTLGRWPPNVCHDGSDDVHRQFPTTRSNSRLAHHCDSGKPANILGAFSGRRRPRTFEGDSGSAARFYNAFPADAAPFAYHPKANKVDRAGSKHPTIKPQGLMRHYCRLVTPPGGLVLDPFAGSGSTLQAARDEGFDAIGIEMEAGSVTDCYARLGIAMPDLQAAE